MSESAGSDAVGVVIAGTGLIARFHAQAVKDSAATRLVAVCGRDAARTKAFCAESGGEAYTDLDAALSRPDAGLLLVATASGAHDEAVFAAARHRVPVLVEKPIAITAARVDAMISACREAGVPLGCIFQTRWSEEFEDARRRIAAGELGRITFARADVPWWRDDSYYTGSSWHGTKTMDGGGALINQAIHAVDWLVALMPPVTEVKAFTATLAHPMEAEDTVSAALRFEGGALGQIYATTASYPGRPKRIEITGTKGTLEIGAASAQGTSRPDSMPCDQHRLAIEAFVESMRGGRPYPIDGAEARKSVDLIERIYRSGEETPPA
ncbi:MAG: Gfo/Idh/MocA family oxidoreductase [Kiritimatiellae bacterium]|nr:Gfo/Idh/MocA family oxidoreductase [Kiritimatiellia bacterium]